MIQKMIKLKKLCAGEIIRNEPFPMIAQMLKPLTPLTFDR